MLAREDPAGGSEAKVIVAMPGFHVVQGKETEVPESTVCVSLLGHFSSLECSVESVRER